MRALYLVILLQMVSMAYSGNNDSGTTKHQTTSPPTSPFSVDCGKNLLTLTNKTQIIYGTNGCKVTKNTADNTFQLTPACLSQGSIILENVYENDKVVTAVSTYNVTCDEGQVMVETVAVKINGPTGSPTAFTVLPIPTIDETKVHLILLSDKPTQNNLKSDASSSITAYLGDTLKMVLFSEEKVYVIPLSCEAKVSGNELTNATLWQLHKMQRRKDCFIETDVMKNVFSLKLNTTFYNYTVAEFTAFRFEEHQDTDIVLSCTVRVCSTTFGWCGQEKTALEKCSNNAIGHRRRRRNPIKGELSHGRVHHVSARLRIINDVMSFGGATRATFTVTSLMLTAVAVMIL